MGLFGSSRSKESLLVEAFYKVAGEMGYVSKLLCLEAGADEAEILRDTDFYVAGLGGKSRFQDLENIYFSSFVYLPGRFVWFNEIVYGKRLASLFSAAELKAVTDETAVDALLSKWPKICEDPDQYISATYEPSFIYYDHIEMIRIGVDKDETVPSITVRMLSGFRYKTSVRAEIAVTGTRSNFIDRDDIRFLNARIAERNLRN